LANVPGHKNRNDNDGSSGKNPKKRPKTAKEETAQPPWEHGHLDRHGYGCPQITRDVAQQIADGTLKVPAQYVGGAKQILSKLEASLPAASSPRPNTASPPNTGNVVSAEKRPKAIYSRFIEIERKASRTGAEDVLRKVRVSSGQNPFAAGAAALLGARMSGALDPEQDAMKQVASEYGIRLEQVREIVGEGRKKNWA
jgi:hypothetical protein